MRTALMVLTCFALSAAPAFGQVVAPAGPAAPPAPKPTGPETIRLTAPPAAEVRPSLSWMLLPPVTEQMPGNAVQLYLLADTLPPPPSREQEKVMKWLAMPLSELPVPEASRWVEGYRLTLRQVELAGRREYAQWDYTIHSEGFYAPMPPLSNRLYLARLLALRARVHLAKGQFRQAVGDLQTGMAMARHLSRGPTLIHCLVGAAIAREMLARVDDQISLPGSPNLYWALTALPRPMIDLTRAMAYERSTVLFAYPDLAKLKTGELSAERWMAIWKELRGLAKGAGVDAAERRNWQEQLVDTLSAVKSYTRAKKALIAQGYPAKKVEAMPVHQVIGLHQLAVYEQVRDDMFRWFYLPYWQAHGPLQRAADELRRAVAADPDNVFPKMLPTLGRAYFLTTRLDRRIAALRCVEAIRMHAAAHDGRLPGKLAEVADVPLPLDPTTGKPFGYRVSGNTCILESLAPAGEPAERGLRYELTLEK